MTIEIESWISPNNSEIAAKIMEGEAIIINLVKGTYYSMENVGAFLWELIDRHVSVRTCIDHVTRKYQVAHDVARHDVKQLLSELLTENLILIDNANGQPCTAPPPDTEGIDTYEPPKLNIYNDMEALLALDPPLPQTALLNR